MKNSLELKIPLKIFSVSHKGTYLQPIGWMHITAFPLFLLFLTITILWLSIRFVQPELNLTAGSVPMQHSLHRFYGVETNGKESFHWSGAHAAFVLDGFWDRQVILDLRMTSPRPPSARPARTALESGQWESGDLWKSGDFIVDGAWRKYQVLVPVVADTSQQVNLEVVRFYPDTHDKRTLGVALSHIRVHVPIQTERLFITPYTLLAIPAPPLLYLFLYWSAQRLWGTSYYRKTSAMAIALLIALIAIVPATYATLFPLKGDVLLLLLWLSIGVTGGFLALPTLVHWLQILLRWVQAGTAPVVLPWTRTDYVLALGFGSLALLVRMIVLPTMLWQLIGDDYAVGAFAVNILDGYHQLYYDETGTLASYLLAPIVAVAGASFETLVALPILLTTILTIALYGIGRDLFGRWGGIAAAVWIIMPTAYAMHWTFKLQPSYLEAVTTATLALWGTIRLVYRPLKPNMQIVLMGAIATLSMLALWSGLVTISLVFTCFIVLLVNWKQAIRLPITGYVLALAIGLSLFFILILPAHTHDHHDPIRIRLSMHRLSHFITELAPHFLGIKRLRGLGPVSFPVGLTIVGLTGLATIVAMYQTLYRRSHAALFVLVLGISAFGATLGSTFYEAKRYYLPLYIAIPLLFAILTRSATQIRYGKIIWAPLCIVMLLATNTLSSIGGVDLSTKYARLEPTLTKVLLQDNVRFVYTSYPTAMGILFESGGNIIPSTHIGPQHTSFDPRNEQRVLEGENKDTAFVFLRDGMATEEFETYLNQRDIHCKRTMVAEHYIIYNTCTPFPNIWLLRQILPHGPDPAERQRITAEEVRTWEREHGIQD